MSLFESVYEMVRRVPEGFVASYGQIAGLCEHPHAARTVGWALHGLPDELADPANPAAVPWWRIINASGRISLRVWGLASGRQRALLEDEGVVFGPDDRVDMRRFQWDVWAPPAPRS